MSAVAVAALLFGLRHGRRAPTARVEHDLMVYRAQLEELERDLLRGVLEESEADSARLEVQRRILAADAARAESWTEAKGSRAISVAAAILVPAVAFGAYLWLGNPDIESQPFAGRIGGTGDTAEGQAGGLPDVETMMARLRDRLAANPDDLEGWISLGQTSMLLGRNEEAIEGYRRALALDPGLPGVHSLLGEARFLGADGLVTQAARLSFEAALAIDPSEPRARFYLALAREQDGDREGALAALVTLLKEAPPGAEWVEVVRQRATAMAVTLGLDAEAVLPPPAVAGAPAPSPEAAEALAARLAADPKDFEGWIALARLRAGLGDPAGARAALAEGAEAFQGAPFVQQQFRQAAAELGLEGSAGPSAADVEAAQDMSVEERDAMIRGMVAGLAARLEDEPGDIEGWRMLARSYRVLNEPGKSAEAFGRVADMLPEDMTALLDYAGALIEAADADGPPPPKAVGLLEKIVAREPTNTDALYYLGEAAFRTGDVAGAALYWRRLLTQIPPDGEEYTWLKDRIDALVPPE
ncbi:MAG: c-type cytochrome biogenesis protein CcmI [Kiloniellales bacterium]